MSTIIGISMSQHDNVFTISPNMINAIVQANGQPIAILNLPVERIVDEYVAMIDGLLLSGGGDIDPFLYGEEPLPGLGHVYPERDQFEIMMVKRCLALNKPILGICRGSQILNVAAGGTLYQDIYTQCQQNLLQHKQQAPRSHASHQVHVHKDSKLYHMTGQALRVNSFHHQAVKQLAPAFQATAHSNDGIIEAFESSEHSFVIGIQWHPEMMIERDEHARNIFKHFVEACASSAR